MERNQRIERLAERLRQSERPLRGADLAAELGVSRQAVVQDVAALRSRGVPVRATAEGYLLDRDGCPSRIFAVRHGKDRIADELLTIVENGGRVLDVIVDHPVYGELRGNIGVATRDEVRRFVNLLESAGPEPLLSLSGGFHLHTVEAESEEALAAVETALREKGYLSCG